MLLFEGYSFNVQMHVVVEGLASLDTEHDKKIFMKESRIEEFFVPRNALWGKLQKIELQTDIEISDVEQCEGHWKKMTNYVNEYVSTALKLYQDAE
jgi:hypothetical protein